MFLIPSFGPLPGPLKPLPLGASKTLPGGVTIQVLRAAPPGAVLATKGCEVRLIYEARSGGGEWLVAWHGVGRRVWF